MPPITDSIKQTSAHSMSSLALMPSNIKFANQNPNEKVILLIRQHKIILFGYIIRFLFNLLLPVLFYVMLSWFFSLDFMSTQKFNFSNQYQDFIIVTIILWYMWTFSKFLNDFLKWYYNAYIITSERLIDLDFISVVNHSEKELGFNNIQDAVDVHSGILQTIFDMGRVIVSTASESTTFSLDNVPKSSKIRDFIMDMSIYNSAKK